MNSGLPNVKYDAVVSLGQWCATSLLLQKLGLRSSSGPFDWLLGKDVGLLEYVQIAVSGFAGFLSAENLMRVGEDPAAGHAYYRDAASRFEFRHDFDLSPSPVAEFPRVRAKYDRRIARLLSLLQTRRRVLFVHFRGEGHYADGEIASALGKLRERFPAAAIDLMVLETDVRERAVVASSPCPGAVRLAGDFYDPSRFDAVLGNEKLLLATLRGIRLRGKWCNLARGRIERWRRMLRRPTKRRSI